MKIGFIGLGKMGAGIAGNILKAGHELTVWNRSPAPAQALEELGARRASKPEDTMHGDALFSMLPSDAVMNALGLDGELLASARPGLIHSNCATISTAFARKLAATHEDYGLHYISSPVFGRPDAAEKAQLLVVAGGAAEHIATLKPVYGKIGRKLVVAGNEPDAANLFKIAGNFLIASTLEMLSETFALLRNGSVDPAQFHDVMANSLFAGPVFQNYGAAMISQKFEPAGFELKLGLKDVELAREAAQDLDMTMPLADLVSRHFEEAMEKGMGEKDWSAISAHIAQKAGLD